MKHVLNSSMVSISNIIATSNKIEVIKPTMKPNELQAFNQAVELNTRGMRRAAHAILLNLAESNPGEPNLLLWLAYTSDEASQAQQYIDLLSAADPANPAIEQVRTWAANPVNFSSSQLVTFANPRPLERAEYGYPAITKPSSSTNTSTVTALPTTVAVAWWIEKVEKKNYFGGRVSWKIELEGRPYLIELKHNNTTQFKKLWVNGQPVTLNINGGIIFGGRYEDYFFSIGNIQCAIRIKVYSFKSAEYSLIVNGQLMETGERAVFSDPARRVSLPLSAYIAGLTCFFGAWRLFKGSILYFICGVLAFGFCVWLGRTNTLPPRIRDGLLLLVCIVFFIALTLLWWFLSSLPPTFRHI